MLVPFSTDESSPGGDPRSVPGCAAQRSEERTSSRRRPAHVTGALSDFPVPASCLSSSSGRLLLNQAGCQGEQAATPPTSPAVRYRIYSTARMSRDRLYVFGRVAWAGSNRRLRPAADRALHPDLRISNRIACYLRCYSPVLGNDEKSGPGSLLSLTGGGLICVRLRFHARGSSLVER
jgi:hypothetical protein